MVCEEWKLKWERTILTTNNMTKNLIILILLVSFAGCSSVRQAVSTKTKTEVKEIPVPAITAHEIPGIYQMEIPVDSMYTGEVISGEIKDSTGRLIAEIKYRPKRKNNLKNYDTAGTFSAEIKPAPVRTEVKTETTEIRNEKNNDIYDILLIVAGIVIIVLIIKILK
jgi:hypothetical protein